MCPICPDGTSCGWRRLLCRSIAMVGTPGARPTRYMGQGGGRCVRSPAALGGRTACRQYAQHVARARLALLARPGAISLHHGYGLASHGRGTSGAYEAEMALQ